MVKHTVVDVTVSEVNLLRCEVQLHVDECAIALVDKANNSRELILIHTLVVIGSTQSSNHLIVSSLCHVATIFSTSIITCILRVFLIFQVPNKYVGVLVPVLSSSLVVMRSVPYTAEPVVGSSHLGKIIQCVITCSSNITLLGILIEALSFPFFSVELTSYLTCTSIDMRHVSVIAQYIQIVSLLEVLLGHVDLTKDNVLHLSPCNLLLLTAVHPHFTEIDSNLHVLGSILGNAQLHITVAYNLAVLGLQQHTDQRLTTNGLLSSLFVSHCITLSIN